jgi:hypothetical protein
MTQSDRVDRKLECFKHSSYRAPHAEMRLLQQRHGEKKNKPISPSTLWLPDFLSTARLTTPRVKIGPIEVFDGTPVIDIMSASTRADG